MSSLFDRLPPFSSSPLPAIHKSVTLLKCSQVLRHRCLYYMLLMALIVGLFSCEQKEATYYSYVDALDQIHAGVLRDSGLTGKGVKIGVVDLGFATLPDNPATVDLLKYGQIKMMRQYYPDSQTVFFNHSEKHGFLVTFMMGGKSKRDSVYGGGLAVDADYYLAKVSKSSFETRSDGEEEHRIGLALEDLYRHGVRLVNLSLGYWDEFNEESLNYTTGQMDGKSSRIAKIVQKYADRGMIIVCAAGNTGEYAWHTIWTPADVEDVITVGACSHLRQPFRASYSGVGNPDVSFVKPDVVCYSTWGTSVSTPVITSLIALMLQKDSTLTLPRIKDILHKASSLYPYPNNYVGYGVPDAGKVLSLLENPDAEVCQDSTINSTEDHIVLKTNSKDIVLFQKTGPYVVDRQYHLEAVDGTVYISRKSNISRSTLVMDNSRLVEIFWE